LPRHRCAHAVYIACAKDGYLCLYKIHYPGTALVGDPPTVAKRLQEYADIGIDSFVLSGYPHLEEAWRFAELVFPLLSRHSAVTAGGVFTGGAFDGATTPRTTER
jgi:hypothetical protein